MDNCSDNFRRITICHPFYNFVTLTGMEDGLEDLGFPFKSIFCNRRIFENPYVAQHREG